MVNKKRLDEIKAEAKASAKKVFDTYNVISRELLNENPDNPQVSVRLSSIFSQLDLISKSRDLILNIESGLQAVLFDVEEEFEYLKRNVEEVMGKLDKAKKHIWKKVNI